MNANRARYLSLFFRARLMIVLLGLATAWLLFLWGRQFLSLPTAAVVASLFLLSPTVLAHGHLATLDVGCAFTMLLALLAIRRSALTSGLRGAALAGLAVGVAASVKFTALLLVPIIAVLFPWYRLRSSGLRSPRLRGAGFKPMVRDLGVLVLVALLTINALMAFSGSFHVLGKYKFESTFMRGLQQGLPGWLPVPLPEAYVSGFDAQKLDTEAGEFGSYLLGRWSQSGWWYYNLFALLVKEPEPFLMLLVLAPWFWSRRRGKPGGVGFLLVPAVGLFLFLSLFNRLNIGIRYLLPVIPFLYLLTGPVVEAVLAWRHRWGRRLLTASLLGYFVLSAVLVHPDYLSYFNPISGGPSAGPKLLLDSNVDWGQDLYRVPQLARKLGENETLGLLYFGHVDPGLYGIRYTPVPSQPTRGLLAVSVNFLFGYPYLAPLPGGEMTMVAPDHLAWLRSRTPVAKLGSIWVFDTRGPQGTLK
jgi:4-amino-4-deoxy-L-arabinose transferase-like glycosyltransferase